MVSHALWFQEGFHGFSWFQVGFYVFLWSQVGFSWIQVCFSWVGFHGFSWLWVGFSPFRVGFHGYFIVPGWFLVVQGWFSWFLMLHGSKKVFMIQAHATHLGEEYEEVCEQLFTLAEVSSFIVHFEICVVKTFKLDFQHHSNREMGQQTYQESSYAIQSKGDIL